MTYTLHCQNVFQSLQCSFCLRPLTLRSYVALKLFRKFSGVSSSKKLDLSKPLILSKYTRLEFEQKRWGISDKELQRFLVLQGSDYENLKYRHGKHYAILSKLEKSLRLVTYFGIKLVLIVSIFFVFSETRSQRHLQSITLRIHPSRAALGRWAIC